MKKLFFIVSNLQMHYHTGGKWLIHGTKHHKDNQLQCLELPFKIS